MKSLRTYASPEAFKRALEDRVRAEAARTATTINRTRQLLLFDRLLGRLRLGFGDALLAKGGVVLELRLGRARTTQDVDVRLSASPDGLLGRLQDAGAHDLGDSLRFAVEVPTDGRDAIAGDGVVYEGQRFRVTARIGGTPYGDPFGLDVAFGDVVTGEVEDVEGTHLFSFVGAPPSRIRLYPRETHLAEKLHAFTLPRPSENSRVKDLPDMALLARAGPFEAATLRRALAATFALRASHPLPAALPAPPASWTPLYARMARENGLPWATLQDVAAAAGAFLGPVLAGTAAGGRWNPERWAWER